MHLSLPHLIFAGPPLEAGSILDRLPSSFVEALRSTNGCVAWRGAFHVRGVADSPPWHSLAAAAEGVQSFSALYPSVLPSDLPFAEDTFGDQYLLRDGSVYRLSAESGEVAGLKLALDAFFDALLADPDATLGFDPADAVASVGGQIEAGALLNVYPPFILDTADARTYRPVPTIQQRLWLADLARQIAELPDGAQIRIDPVP